MNLVLVAYVAYMGGGNCADQSEPSRSAIEYVSPIRAHTLWVAFSMRFDYGNASPPSM